MLKYFASGPYKELEAAIAARGLRSKTIEFDGIEHILVYEITATGKPVINAKQPSDGHDLMEGYGSLAVALSEGMGLIEATLEGAKLRLRPIVMTSLAFGFGVLPLAIASGAGAGAQRAIGVAVVGGVVTSTFLVTIFAPLFFVLIEKNFGKHRRQSVARRTETTPTGSH